ncbi:MAG: putative ABC transporter permease [Defluviitaleaceae bacterium]|nr:putative ABC transporter permease [Defluviitaleaceae bacterium]
MLIRFVIYGALGCLIEVLWTGLCELRRKNFTLNSSTSLWMFFIYGTAVFAEPLFRIVAPLNFLLRGTIYAVLIFAVEFLTGSLLKRADVCPWDYSHTRYHVKGLIRFDYLPAWIIVGLFFEQIYFAVT